MNRIYLDKDPRNRYPGWPLAYYCDISRKRMTKSANDMWTHSSRHGSAPLSKYLGNFDSWRRYVNEVQSTWKTVIRLWNLLSFSQNILCSQCFLYRLRTSNKIWRLPCLINLFLIPFVFQMSSREICMLSLKYEGNL